MMTTVGSYLRNAGVGTVKPKSKRASGKPTIADVARLSGVGTTTVSRALRNPQGVSLTLRKQINAAINQLGYTLDRNARALAAARADTVAVLVPSLANSVFAEVVRGLYVGLGESQFQIQLGNTHYSGIEEERLLRVFLSQRPSAIVISGIDQTPAARKMLQDADCPVVQIMETGPDPIGLIVGFSHFEGGRTAARHLIKSGYRRIGFIGARMDPRSQRRLAGYRVEVEAAGLYDQRLVTTTPAPSSVSLGSQLIREAFSKAPDLDAVFCNNDDIALGVLFECARSGFPVPDRIGIMGFNDLEMMAAAYPSLTSIRTPRFEIGVRAMQVVLSAIAGNLEKHPVVDLGFELRVRESTKRND